MMGHYLGEMEDDGVPRSWKAGRHVEHKVSRYEPLQKISAKKRIESFIGVSLTWDEVEIFLDQFSERTSELKPFKKALYRAEKELIANIVQKLRPAQAIEARSAETRSGSVHESAVVEDNAPKGS